MSHPFGVILLLAITAAALTALAALASWWFEPGHRVERVLRQGLAGPPDVMTVAPARGQGAALRIEDETLAIVRGLGDPGLVYDLSELIGAELIFDGAVCAPGASGAKGVGRWIRSIPRSPASCSGSCSTTCTTRSSNSSSTSPPI